MQRTTKYVALDVHQATTEASVREETGRVIARTIVPTEEAALVEFVRGMRGAIHVAFEGGTQAQWLHDLLGPVVDRVVVCSRRGERGQGNKGDQIGPATKNSCAAESAGGESEECDNEWLANSCDEIHNVIPVIATEARGRARQSSAA